MASPSASPDPWELAKARFLDVLEPHEKELFNNATLENIYYATSNANRDDAEKSKTRGLVKKLGPLVAAIESYGSALDTYAQTATLYLAPIWGSIRVVLVVARAHEKFFGKIVDTLERIGDILPRFRDYERIYNGQKHQRLTQTLSNTYLDIITLCAEFRKALREQKGSKVRRLLKPLSVDKQFDEAIEKFRQHKQNVEDEARTCHMIEAAEQRDAQLVLFATERRRKLLTRLSKVDCKDRHRMLKDSRHEGTGLWFTSSPQYKEWNEVSQSSVLCCYGIPGCGKSVLVSSVVDSFDADGTLIYYYCDFKDKRTLEPSNVFGTLARQVLETLELLPEAIALQIEHSEHDGERMADHLKAFAILQQSIELVPSPINLIFDGIDEATEASQILICKELKQLVELSNIHIKLFITGREDLASLLTIDSAIPFSRVPLSPKSISSDIEKYIQASTRRRIKNGSLVIQDPELEQLIVKKLVKGAKGMFLWVEFQLQDLCEAESDNGILLVLKHLPRSLGETYKRLLGKIEGAERRHMILRMFKWIVCAREPLHLEELREGVAFTLDDLAYDPRKLPTDLTRLVRACGNLVVVDEETQIIQLAHHTVQQYLLQQDGDPFQFELKCADIMAAEFCVAYLSFTNFESQVTRFADNKNTDMLALGRIASHGPMLHADHPGQKVVRVLNTIRNSRPQQLNINMTSYVPPQKRMWQPASFTFLAYVVSNWLWHTIAFDTGPYMDSQNYRRDGLFRSLVLKKQLLFDFRPWGDFNKENSQSSAFALLSWALTANHPYLIRVAASESELFVRPETLIAEAWYFTRDMVMRKSKKYPLSLETGEYVGWWPRSQVRLYSKLVSACQKGHLNAIKACTLDNLEQRSTYYFTEMIGHLIAVSASEGMLTVLQHLIDDLLDIKGARVAVDFAAFNFVVQSKIDCDLCLNAIEHAAVSGYPDVVKYLAEQGARPGNIFANKAIFEDLVNAAIDDNSIEKVESFLILRRVNYVPSNPEGASNRFSSPRLSDALIRAIRTDRVNIVRLLLEYEIRPSTQALIDAIIGSHESIVSTLLDHKCYLGNTHFVMPLTVAACIGNTAVAQDLILHGAELFRQSFKTEVVSAMVSIREVARSEYNPRFPKPHAVFLSPTPLYMACYHGHRSIVELLISYGAAINFPSPKTTIRMTHPQTLVNYRNIPIPSYSSTIWPGKLMDVELGDVAGLYRELPIEAAAKMGYEDIVEVLLSSGALMPEEFEALYGCYLGSPASQQRKFEVDLAASLSSGAMLKPSLTPARAIKRISPSDSAACIHSIVELHVLCLPSAIFQQEELKMQILQLRREVLDAEPHCLDPLQAALVLAVERGMNDIVHELLRTGTNIATLGDDGIPLPNPRLFLAAKAGNLELRNAFVDIVTVAASRYINVPTSSYHEFRVKALWSTQMWLQNVVGSTIVDNCLNPLYCAILELAAEHCATNRTLVRELYASLAFPPDGLSPMDAALFTAVDLEDQFMIRLLCTEGANVNARNVDGATPFINAAAQGSPKEVIEALLAQKPNTDIADNDGDTAFDKAADNRHFHVIEVLVNAGHIPAPADLQGTLGTLVMSGDGDAWRTLTRRELHQEVELTGVDTLLPYTVSRGLYLRSLPCQQIQGLFQLPVHTDWTEEEFWD